MCTISFLLDRCIHRISFNLFGVCNFSFEFGLRVSNPSPFENLCAAFRFQSDQTIDPVSVNWIEACIILIFMGFGFPSRNFQADQIYTVLQTVLLYLTIPPPARRGMYVA